ncbi:MAG: signal peptide peptidase SppA [Candidatus Electrothrix aestuarii]|uniref:Signal peptide peptidase SppA n=1 Tax=Candidatus Electrothrix aestuarii TaxID=3062594 RepID=A0AAU8LWA7_9BACT|nr:signal peptide peptidase SppA [Candidatus Electrothrix aestuarii]
MKKILRCIGTIIRITWKILITGTALVSTLLFLCGLGMIFSLAGHQKEVHIENGSALVLAPFGTILEKKSSLEPATRLLHLLNGTLMEEELLLQDIINGIRAAAHDSRIKLLVLAPDRLEMAGLNQLQDIAKAIAEFKKSGKRVIAYGDSFSQGQYYLAAQGDEVYLNPMGEVDLHGFGVFRLYMRELLDILKINFHVFRVGTFKSALEPFFRSDMSPEAKEANLEWLTQLWQQFCGDIAGQRGLALEKITDAADHLPENLQKAEGDTARMAMDLHLVDGIKTQAEFREYMISLVGKNKKKIGFKRVGFSDYIETRPPAYQAPMMKEENVALIIAQGDIVYGAGEYGQIGSTGLTKLLRKAQRSKNVKAVVLRIDSGGGSAFASELIRQEILQLKKAGKPIVVSMGSMAASGGYWIAADADKIYASPNTITGSIGIFGAFPTIEKSLAEIGVFNDGVGTTKMAGQRSMTRSLSESYSATIQMNVERGYRQFLQIVAQGRGMEISEVEKIAEGRVWDGTTALRLGLVDALGSLDDAVRGAAKMVGLPANKAYYLQGEKTPAELFLQRLEGAMVRPDILSHFSQQLVRSLAGQHAFLPAGDPKNMYSHCLLPFSVQ